MIYARELSKFRHREIAAADKSRCPAAMVRTKPGSPLIRLRIDNTAQSRSCSGRIACAFELSVMTRRPAQVIQPDVASRPTRGKTYGCARSRLQGATGAWIKFCELYFLKLSLFIGFVRHRAACTTSHAAKQAGAAEVDYRELPGVNKPRRSLTWFGT